MSMKSLASALTSSAGEPVALSDVAVNAVLRDLLAEVTVSQTYRNDERINIEAVYTFPLPLDAVLLELQVVIGGRVLKGAVVGKQDAEEAYEDAVDSGDAAVMLQELEPGLYTMNVGNILPGEQVTITFTYAMVYRWTGDGLRFFLPTTIAPRYGESPHQPQQVPEASLTVENQFSLQVEISGSLREAQFTCPSHEVKQEIYADRVVISLQQARAVMDRDFILNIRAPQVTRCFVQCGADGEGMAALASFQPFFPGLQQPRRLNLAIVVDCSGSMAGDSMQQARQALKGIIDLLQPQDRMTIVAFGSTTNALSDGLLICNKTNLAKARRFTEKLHANLGGTEIGGALQTAYDAVLGTESGDIFLVTDGEVSSWESVVHLARQSGHRIFTVGVGSAVSEAFVRGLATATGGACELVSPREGMSDRVIRHFERMRAPRAKRVNVNWPEGARDLTPANIGAVFEGDTINLSAGFDQQLTSGTVALEVEMESGETWRHELALMMPSLSESENDISTVARLAASTRLREPGSSAGSETALRYRLISPWTHWLVVAERTEEERAQDLPVLRKVPQTLAAGWGGTGDVLACLSLDMVRDPAPKFSRSLSEASLQKRQVEYLDMPSFLRDSGDDSKHGIPKPFRQLLALIEEDPDRLDSKSALKLLDEAGLKAEFRELFTHAEQLGISGKVIATIILAELLRGPLNKHLPDEAQFTLALLQDQACHEESLIKELGQRGTELLHMAHEGASRDIFNYQVRDSLARFAGFHDLLEHARHWVKHLVSKDDSRDQRP